jgi:hypothetical protein
LSSRPSRRVKGFPQGKKKTGPSRSGILAGCRGRDFHIPDKAILLHRCRLRQRISLFKIGRLLYLIGFPTSGAVRPTIAVPYGPVSPPQGRSVPAIPVPQRPVSPRQGRSTLQLLWFFDRIPHVRGGQALPVILHSHRFPHLRGGQALSFLQFSDRLSSSGTVASSSGVSLLTGFPTWGSLLYQDRTLVSSLAHSSCVVLVQTDNGCCAHVHVVVVYFLSWQ